MTGKPETFEKRTARAASELWLLPMLRVLLPLLMLLMTLRLTPVLILFISLRLHTFLILRLLLEAAGTLRLLLRQVHHNYCGHYYCCYHTLYCL